MTYMSENKVVRRILQNLTYRVLERINITKITSVPNRNYYLRILLISDTI